MTNLILNETKTMYFKEYQVSLWAIEYINKMLNINLPEDEARKQDLDVIIKKLPVMAIPRAKTLGETDGLLKAVIDKNTGKIVGCMLFAPDAGEVINIVAMAMKTGQDYTFLRDFIFTHPSMSEALNDLFS